MKQSIDFQIADNSGQSETMLFDILSRSSEICGVKEQRGFISASGTYNNFIRHNTKFVDSGYRNSRLTSASKFGIVSLKHTHAQLA